MTNYLQREALYSSQSPRHCSPRMIRQTIPTKDIIPVEVDSVFLSLRLKPSPQKKSIYKGNGFAPRIYYSPQKYDPEGWEDDGWTLSNDLHHLDEDVFYTPTTLKSYRNRGKSSRPHKRGQLSSRGSQEVDEKSQFISTTMASTRHSKFRTSHFPDTISNSKQQKKCYETGINENNELSEYGQILLEEQCRYLRQKFLEHYETYHKDEFITI